MFVSFLNSATFVFVLMSVSANAIGQDTGAIGKSKEEVKRADNLPSGINDSFLDPNMKVEDFIKRFEVESREVFACREQILAALEL